MQKPREVETELILFSCYKSFFLGYKHFFTILPRTIKYSLAPCSQKVLEAGGTIVLAEDPFWNFFGSKKNTLEIWLGSF